MPYEIELILDDGSKEKKKVSKIRILKGPSWPVYKKPFESAWQFMPASCAKTIADLMQAGYYLGVIRQLMKPDRYFETFFRKIWIQTIASIAELSLKSALDTKGKKVVPRKVTAVTLEGLIDAAHCQGIIEEGLKDKLHGLRKSRNRIHPDKEIGLPWPKGHGTEVFSSAGKVLEELRGSLETFMRS